MTSFFSYFVFFLVVEKICKNVPLSGKEQPKNYRKFFLKDIKGSSSKLQIEEKEREATEKVDDIDDIKRIEQKKEKGEATTAILLTKVKIEQQARIGRVPHNGKKKSGEVKKIMHKAGCL